MRVAGYKNTEFADWNKVNKLDFCKEAYDNNVYCGCIYLFNQFYNKSFYVITIFGLNELQKIWRPAGISDVIKNNKNIHVTQQVDDILKKLIKLEAFV